MTNFKIQIGFISLISLIGFVGQIGYAQISPQFMVSWQADSTAPAWYSGKIFPTKDSPVEISFELIDSSSASLTAGGKIVDLSKTTIRWYINDKLVKNESDGLGIKYLKFITADYPGQDTEIRISIPNYKNFGPLDKIIAIPIVKPQTIIIAPYSDRKITAGKSVFEAIPFFFSAKDLSNITYKWFVDNRVVSDIGDNQRILDFNIPQEVPKGTVVNIKATIKNLLKDLEFSSGNLNVEIK
ncbi:MAG: hypothetical protein AAB405_02295 [Patescibacteria group bacterium]